MKSLAEQLGIYAAGALDQAATRKQWTEAAKQTLLHRLAEIYEEQTGLSLNQSAHGPETGSVPPAASQLGFQPQAGIDMKQIEEVVRVMTDKGRRMAENAREDLEAQ